MSFPFFRRCIRPLFFVFFFCVSLANAKEQVPLVLVSVPPQAFLIREIAGSRVEVESIIPPRANHGAFEPGMNQLKSVSAASMYFKVGHPAFMFETDWVTRFLELNPNLRVIDSGRGIEQLSGDIHLWVSPKSMAQMARNVAAALAENFPGKRATFEKNLSMFLEKVAVCDKEFSELSAEVTKKSFIVFHPEWGYVASDYGFKQIAIEQDGKEPDAERIAEVITFAKDNGIRTIFVQPQFPEDSANTIAREINGHVVTLDPFAEDWFVMIKGAVKAFRAALS